MGITLIAIVGPLLLAAVITGFVLKQTGVIGPKRRIVRTGLQGMATIMAVTPTGTVINEVKYLCRFDLRVELPGQAPYDVQIKDTVLITEMGQIGAGTRIGVRGDPADHQKVFLDRSGAAMPAPTAGQAAAELAANPQEHLPYHSAADLLARGQRVKGVLREFADSGRTPRTEGRTPARPEWIDDPFYVLTIDLQMPQGSLEGAVVHRVPRARVGELHVGKVLDCAIDPANPTRMIAVDWGDNPATPATVAAAPTLTKQTP